MPATAADALRISKAPQRPNDTESQPLSETAMVPGARPTHSVFRFGYNDSEPTLEVHCRDHARCGAASISYNGLVLEAKLQVVQENPSMKPIADRLPPEIARQLHPDRRKNELEYWESRDQLLKEYQDQWIGFADGKVVASGTSPVTVLHAAEASGRNPFVICVGHEEEPCRIRRATFAYDTGYRGEALPLIRLEFRQTSGARGAVLDRVIPDTGADASVLPWTDCQQLKLTPAHGLQGLIHGVAGTSAATLTFHIWAFLDGRQFPCRVQADFVGKERIIGRDVLNRLDVLFCGPASEVIVNP